MIKYKKLHFLILATFVFSLVLFFNTNLVYANQGIVVDQSPSPPWWTSLYITFSFFSLFVPVIQLIILIAILIYLKKTYDAIKKLKE